jgi:hypothetical protein
MPFLSSERVTTWRFTFRPAVDHATAGLDRGNQTGRGSGRPLRGAHALRLAPLAERLERRRATLTHFEPRLGNLLLRWAVSVVSERYAAVKRAY